jgi:hypothetical protein
LVIDETARSGKALQVAKLFAIRQGFELVALHPQHGSIVVAPWQDIKTFATADTLSSHCTYTWSSSQSIGIEYSMEMRSRDFEGCSPNSLKCVSQNARQERPDLAARYWKGVLWSPSYFAARSGGAPINILKDYIRQQKTPL